MSTRRTTYHSLTSGSKRALVACASRRASGRRSQCLDRAWCATCSSGCTGAHGRSGRQSGVHLSQRSRRRNGMEKLLRNVLVYVTRDEAGAELPEWTIWVAVLAVVGTALVTPVTTGLTTAFTTVLGSIPGVS